jgi:hypothetical protein
VGLGGGGGWVGDPHNSPSSNICQPTIHEQVFTKVLNKKLFVYNAVLRDRIILVRLLVNILMRLRLRIQDPTKSQLTFFEIK